MVISSFTSVSLRILLSLGAVVVFMLLLSAPQAVEAQCGGGGSYQNNPYGVNGELFSSNPNQQAMGERLSAAWRSAYGNGADTVFVSSQNIDEAGGGVSDGGSGGCGDGGYTPLPSALIDAIPLTIMAGSSAELGWGSTDVGACSINQGIGSVTPNEPGIRTITPTVTTTYTITCDGTYTDSVTVTVTGAPDLMGQVGGAATASLSQAVTLYGGVANESNAPAGYFPNLIQVCDANCATVNTTLAATETASLNGFGWQAVQASYTPSAQGQQYYRVCANNTTSWVNVHSETNYANNCSGWQYLTVGTPIPDLTAGEISPNSAVRNQTVTLTGTITNMGTSGAGASTGYFTLTAPVSKQSTTATVAVPAIAAGGSHVASFSYKFLSEGTYTVRLCADWGGAVAESNEGNNCGPLTYIAVVDIPMANSVSCNVSTQSPVIGQSVTYTAIASGLAGSPYGWTGSDGATGFGSGTTAVRTFSTTGTYGMQVTASGAGSPAQCPLVTVGANWCTAGSPTLTITATPNRVRAGQSSVVTWSASGVNGEGATCTVSGLSTPWTSAVSAAPICSAGSSATETINTQRTFTLTCGGQSESVTVNVIPGIIEF